MFKKKIATQAAKAAVGVASAAAAAGSGAPSASSPPPTSSTSSPTAAVGTTAVKRRSPSRGSPGAKARTLALIEKHRKLLEEAQQQKEEMENITQEQTRLQRQQQQQQGSKKGASSSASSPSSSASASRTQEDASASPAPPAASRKEPTPAAVASPCPTAADAKPDAFTALIDQFLAATQPLADLDETIQEREASTPASASPSPPAAERPTPRRSPAPSTTAAAARPPVLTHRSFAASLTCPKKFYLFQNRTDLIPKASVGDVMHFDDSVGFNELARRWDRLQFGSRAKLVRESDFGQAVQRTEDLIVDYFQGPHAALGEQAPTLTIHRPAFAVEFPGGSGDEGGAAGLELRARPTVLRYRPKENQWVFIDAQAVIDPVSTSARITHTIQKFHFSILCFRLWLTQPHLPIELRKKFFQVDLDGITEESLKGHSLESSARPAAPVDMKRSGLLHIRQFFPGPATLVDCPPPQLVKFIQRLSLEELLEEDGKHYMRDGGRGGAYYAGGAGGAFDLRNCHSSVAHNSTVKARVAEMDGHARELGKILSARTVRSQKHKDETLLNLFEAQQRVVHDMLRHHTVPLMKQQRRLTNADHRGASTTTTAAEEERGVGGEGEVLSATDAAQLTALTAFSGLLGDEGFVRASQSPPPASDDAAETSKGGKKGTVKAAARKLKGAKAKQKGSAAAGEGEEEDGEGGEGEAKEGLGGSVGAAAAASPPCYGRHIGPQCVRGGDACPFFVEGMCLPRKVSDPVTARDNHLFTLPSTSLTRKSAWWAEGKRTIRDVLTAYERATTPMRLTHAQLRYAAALTQGQVALNPDEIDSFFAKIRYPLFVIDFEAVQFALPPFQKEVAYQSIPFQFSLDVFQNDVLTEEPTHYNYLHFGKGCSPNTDPRPSCVAELLRIVRLEREKKRLAMESTGELARLEAERLAAEAAAEAELAANSTGRRGRKPKAPKKPKITKANPPEEPQRPHDGSFIAHFASFEKSCLEKLGQLVEEYKEEIKEFYFLDTLDLIKKGCVHPNAHGSNSLKKVLPALCPDFQYGVFGSEVNPSDDLVNGAAAADGAGAGGGGGGAAAAAEGQDEQKGENAMGVYRLWYHLEGGGTVQDLQRASRGLNGPADPASSAESTQWSESVRTTMTAEEREQMWETLRTQLLEYCSLDTKALYEIMREIHHVRDAIDDDAPRDKNGWVYIKPVPREMDL